MPPLHKRTVGLAVQLADIASPSQLH